MSRVERTARHARGSNAPRRAFGWRGGLAVASAVALMGLAACGAPKGAISDWELTQTTEKPAGDIDQVTWAVYAEPFSLDYAYAFDYPDNQVLSNVCESLLRWEPDLSLGPGLAESWDNPDPKTWVYHLRDGVKFHDGSTMTADDAVASMKRHLDPAVGSFWYASYANVDSIEATGDLEVTVKLNKPDAMFNQAMGNVSGVVESAKTLKEKGKDYGNSKGGVNCTGPFEFDKWTSGDSIHLKRFDDYWDKDLAAKSQDFTFQFMPDANARINALKSGEVDGSWMVPAEAVPQLRAGTGGDVYFGKNATVTAMVASDLSGPLGDPKVRQAAMMALDREGILKAGAGGYGTLADSTVATSLWENSSKSVQQQVKTDVTSYPHDVEQAKKLIDDAGVKGQEVVIATAPLGNDATVSSQATAAALKEIGLKPKIKTMTVNAYTTLFSDPSARKGVDLFFTQWYNSSPDPLELLSVMREGEFSNYGNWSDPEFDKVVNKALATQDDDERAALSAEAAGIMSEQVPWLPYYEPPTMVYLSDRVTGLSPSINFMYYPWAATLGAR
ncbi:MAG: ABC transporter substrate-binding protein [Galactobacter sp.]|uniref:ABC transporter substrate-binding protein n=1 Tax=Galactobacter sp. TaxID=2676125 RepID=UPI0025BEA97B|nr:ABC transporter substrate-binding protein [Galactobacter sp.]